MLAMRTRAATSHAMAALRWGRAGPYLVREVRRFGSERHAPLRLEPVLDALGTHRSNQDPLGTPFATSVARQLQGSQLKI